MTRLGFRSLGLPLAITGTARRRASTDIYTLQYDGWADYPQYPLNILADLNAFCRHRLCARRVSGSHRRTGRFGR